MRPTTLLNAAAVHPAGAGIAAAVHHGSGGISTAAIVIAAIAGLLALGCAAWGLARVRAFEPRWSLSLRHALDEASLRASSTWAELSEWARLGR